MQGKVEICGVNTATLPVLKSAETRALLERARAGVEACRAERRLDGHGGACLFLDDFDIVGGIYLDLVAQAYVGSEIMLEHSAEEPQEVGLDVLADEWTGHAQGQQPLAFVEAAEGDGGEPRVELLAGDVVGYHPQAVVPPRVGHYAGMVFHSFEVKCARIRKGRIASAKVESFF